MESPTLTGTASSIQMAQPPTSPTPAVRGLQAPQPAPDGPALWRDRDFRRFWMSQGVSSIGDEVSALALPLIAVLTLDASATQMGLINALGYLRFLIVGLQAGVWVDRMRRRQISFGPTSSGARCC